MEHSPQMTRLLERYGVTSERDLLRAIRDEYLEETDERLTLRVCGVLLDQMLEAEYQRIAGGAYERVES